MDSHPTRSAARSIGDPFGRSGDAYSTRIRFVDEMIQLGRPLQEQHMNGQVTLAGIPSLSFAPP
jgi:hypothetical protein